MATDELVYQIDLDWDKMGFKNLQTSMNNSIKNFAKITAAVTVASGAVFAFGKKMGDYGDSLLDQAKQSNTSTESLEKLKFAAEQNKATYDSLTSSLDNLATAQFEVLRGKGDFEAWGRIGINPSDYEDTADLLMAISDGVNKIDNQAEKINVIERLGISRDLLQTLEQGSDGLKQLGDEAERLGAISSQKFLKASEDFANGWGAASTAVSGIFKEIAGGLLDETINPAIEAFTKFAKDNMGKIVSTIQGIMNVIAEVSKVIYAIIQRVMIQFDRLSSALGGTENALKAIGAAFILLKARSIAAMAPAILMIGALYLAFDEFMSFLSGEESFLGDFLGVFGIANTDVKEFISGLDAMDIGIAAIILGVGGLTKSFGLLKTALLGIGKTPIGKALLLGTAAYIAIDQLVNGGTAASVKTAGGALINRSDIEAGLSRGMSPEQLTGIINQAGGSKSLASNVTVNVNGASDPKAIVEEIKRQMDNSAARAGY